MELLNNVAVEKQAISNLSTGAISPNASNEIIASEIRKISEEFEEEHKAKELTFTGVASKVMAAFQRNSEARKDSGIEEEIQRCAWANLGKYTPSELSALEANKQPNIYMRVTPTKIRAAQALIKDILLAENDIFSLSAKELPALPEGVMKRIAEGVNQLRDKQEAGDEVALEQQTDPEVKGNEVTQAQATIIEELEEARAIEDALYEEMKKHTSHEIEKINRMVKNDMVKGDWNSTLDEFIDDYCVFPTAFIRGPVQQMQDTLVWENGQPVIKSTRVYKDKRIAPIDMYPDPGSPTLQKGDLVEHARFTRSDIELMLDSSDSDTFTERMEKLLETDPAAEPWFSTSVETEKAGAEQNGNSRHASNGVYHALIYNGRVKKSDLEKDGIYIGENKRSAEIKAIMVDGQLVSVKINNDPMGRRNYHCASYHNVPGSVWGVALATLMSDIQKVCNGAARSLVVNMGFSAGPQAAVQVERLVDKGDIEDMTPLKIWQVEAPKSGNEGEAVKFFSVPSTASILSNVFDKFESKADDATGIPRYSYGNSSNTGGAGSTAKGLGLLLETASKNIKEAVRHIDKGLIIPRVGLQFYWTVRTAPEIKYTGELSVIAHGSQTLAMKAALEQKRKEFFSLTTNEYDFKTIKQSGRAVMLRALADDCEFGETVVPNSLKLKHQIDKEEKMKEREMAAKEQQAQGGNSGVQSTKIQADAMKEIAAANKETSDKKLNLDSLKHQDNLQVEAAKVDVAQNAISSKAIADVEGKQIAADASRDNTRVNSAVKIATGK